MLNEKVHVLVFYQLLNCKMHGGTLKFINDLFPFRYCSHSFQSLEFSISFLGVQTVVAVVCNWTAVVAIVFRCKCITLESVFLLRTYWFVMTSDLR